MEISLEWQKFWGLQVDFGGDQVHIFQNFVSVDNCLSVSFND